jgi:hypothetical protein
MPSPEAVQAVNEAQERMDAARDELRAIVESDDRPADYYQRHRAAVDALNVAIGEFFTAIGRAHNEG